MNVHVHVRVHVHCVTILRPFHIVLSTGNGVTVRKPDDTFSQATRHGSHGGTPVPKRIASHTQHQSYPWPYSRMRGSRRRYCPGYHIQMAMRMIPNAASGVRPRCSPVSEWRMASVSSNPRVRGCEGEQHRRRVPTHLCAIHNMALKRHGSDTQLDTSHIALVQSSGWGQHVRALPEGFGWLAGCRACRAVERLVAPHRLIGVATCRARRN